MSVKENALLNGSVRPVILKYALPIILSMMATQFYSVADTMIIGLKLDANALAAVSNASTALMFFLFVSGGMELAGGLLVASNKPTACKNKMAEIFYNLIFVDLILALIMLMLGWFGLSWILKLIQTPSEILEEAILYGRIYLLGLPFLMVYDLTKECVIGCGNSKVPLYTIIATSLMNIILDFIFVGLFGVAGAAWATAVSQVAGAIFMLYYLNQTELGIPFEKTMLKSEYTKDIIRLSAPNSLQQASGTLITTVRQSLLGGLGVAAIAGFSCANKISSLLMMAVYGFVQSIVFFIAQNTTANNIDRVHEGLKEGRKILFVYSLLVALSCTFLNRGLMRLFTNDQQAIMYGCTILAYEGFTYIFQAQKHLNEARLRGAQKMGLYLISNLGQIGINVIACIILVPMVGFNGFWISTWISAPIGLVLAIFLNKIGENN